MNENEINLMNRNSITATTRRNDILLMSLESELQDYRLLVQDKLYFYVQKTGKKYWQIRYKKEDSKWSWHGLGVFPTINMKQAIQLANQFTRQCEEGDFSFGKNPLSQKYKLVTLIDRWIQIAKENWCKDVLEAANGMFKNHVYPIFGERDFRSITSCDKSNQ